MSSKTFESGEDFTTDFYGPSSDKDWKIGDVMISNPLCIRETDVLNFYDPKLPWRQYRHLPVVDSENVLKGILSHRDIMDEAVNRLVGPQTGNSDFTSEKGIPVNTIMKKEVVSIHPEATVQEAAYKMFSNKCGCLPVVDERNRVLGIVTEADLVKLFYLYSEGGCP